MQRAHGDPGQRTRPSARITEEAEDLEDRGDRDEDGRQRLRQHRADEAGRDHLDQQRHDQRHRDDHPAGHPGLSRRRAGLLLGPLPLARRMPRGGAGAARGRRRRAPGRRSPRPAPRPGRSRPGRRAPRAPAAAGLPRSRSAPTRAISTALGPVSPVPRRPQGDPQRSPGGDRVGDPGGDRRHVPLDPEPVAVPAAGDRPARRRRPGRRQAGERPDAGEQNGEQAERSPRRRCPSRRRSASLGVLPSRPARDSVRAAASSCASSEGTAPIHSRAATTTAAPPRPASSTGRAGSSPFTRRPPRDQTSRTPGIPATLTTSARATA